MNTADPQCVLTTQDLKEAAATATWLTEAGVPSKVIPVGDGETVVGLAVWVTDPELAADAAKLIAERDAEKERLAQERATRGPTTVTCEECGTTTVFPPEDYGSTQSCPTCGAFLDVESDEFGGNDEDWGETDDEA